MLKYDSLFKVYITYTLNYANAIRYLFYINETFLQSFFSISTRIAAYAAIVLPSKWIFYMYNYTSKRK